MTGEMQARRLEPCDHARPCEDRVWSVSYPAMPCVGCNGDGTRWVTVGTLRPPRGIGRNQRSVPVWFEDGQEFDWIDEVINWEGAQPLYVIEEET